MSATINMLLSKAIDLQEGSPDPSPERAAVTGRERGRHAAFGCLRGKIHVPEDFDEPLDDFRMYMQ
ncbi:MAG: DUF2281 domain-containing protein [Methanomassiliicoccaceae archaeon]|nr:DUF2281 domain-containing protein [Methanomassiliicoccaceae archaeon]